MLDEVRGSPVEAEACKDRILYSRLDAPLFRKQLLEWPCDVINERLSCIVEERLTGELTNIICH